MWRLWFAAVPEVAEQKIVIKKILTLYKGFLRSLPQLLFAIIIIGVTWLFSQFANKVLTRVLKRSKMRQSLQELLQQFASIVVWFIGISTAAIVVFPSLTPGRMLAALGLSSVAVGFAFKNIFENFFAGVLILWRFPFEQGDFIKCEGVFGKVERISIRNTLIRQPDGQLVIVPNAQLFTKAVNVLTSEAVRRTEAVVGIAYHEDIEEAREVIRQSMRSLSSVSQYRGIQILVDELDSSSVNFKVVWWTQSTPQGIRKSRDEVITAVKQALDKAGIEIPFPYRTLTWNSPLPIQSAHKGLNGQQNENNETHETRDTTAPNSATH